MLVPHIEIEILVVVVGGGGASFMDAISGSLANDLKVKLDEANLLSLLMD